MFSKGLNMMDQVLNVLLINDDEDDSFILDEVVQYFPNISLDNIHPNYRIGDELYQRREPNIILLDLYMSKMSGFDILKQLKGSRSFRHIPVIIYSSKQHSNVVRKCFDLGAKLFIEKPHTYKGVERMIKKIASMDWNESSLVEEHGFILEADGK